MRYEEPEFARFEPDERLPGAGRMVCPCGMRFGVGFAPCDRRGELVLPASSPGAGAVVRCLMSGHIITADGVVIGRREEAVA